MAEALRAACDVRRKYELDHPPDCFCKQFAPPPAPLDTRKPPPRPPPPARLPKPRAPPPRVSAAPPPPAAAASAAHFEIVGVHARQGLLHARSSFTLLAYDVQGRRLTRGGAQIRASSRGPAPLHAAVADRGDGSYEVSYHASLSGEYLLSLSCQREAVRGSPLRLHVEPAAACAAACEAEGDGLSVGVAGDGAAFVVRAMDEGRRPKIMGGEVFEAFLAARGAQGEALQAHRPLRHSSLLAAFDGRGDGQVTITDLGNGTYRGTYTPRNAGDFLLHVRLGGAPIRGSPFSVRVCAGVADAARCALRGDAATVGTAGQRESFRVDTFDRYGNPRAAAKDDAAALVASLLPLKVEQRTGPLKCTVQAGRDGGSFVVHYAATVAGEYALALRLDGEDIPHSSTVTILPAETCASCCIATGDGLVHATAGSVRASFTISSRDAYGNARDCSDGSFDVTLRRRGAPPLPPPRGAGVSEEAAGGAARCCGRLEYDGADTTASYTPTVAGLRQMEVRYRGEHIHGSPFRTRVSAAAPCAEASCRGAASPHAVAGEKGAFALLTHDEFGNPSVAEAPEVAPAGEGKFTVSYTLEHASDYLVEVTIGAHAIPGSPFPLRVGAGPCEPACCRVLEPIPQRLTAGHSAAVRVLCCDRFHNVRVHGGDRVEAQLLSDPCAKPLQLLNPNELLLAEVDVRHPAPQVLDELNGAYTISFGCCATGQLLLFVSIGGAQAAGSPFPIDVTEAAVCPSHTIAFGPDLAGGVAGRILRIGLIFRDVFGNRCHQVPSHARLLLRGVADVEGRITQLDDDSTVAAVQPCLAGRYWAHLTIEGQHVRGSPFSMRVLPAPAVAHASEVWGGGLSEGVAGVRASFFVQLRDEFGNASARDVALLRARLVAPVQSARTFPIPSAVDSPSLALPLEEAEGDDGCGAALVQPAQGGGEDHEAPRPPPHPREGPAAGFCVSRTAGRHLLHLTLGDEALPGSPFQVTVRAGPTAAHATLLHGGASLVGARAGQQLRLQLLARDRFGNPRGEGGDDFHLFVHGASKPEEQRLLDLGSGEYELQLRLPISGEYLVHVALGRLAVNGSPVKLELLPPSPPPHAAAGSELGSPRSPRATPHARGRTPRQLSVPSPALHSGGGTPGHAPSFRRGSPRPLSPRPPRLTLGACLARSLSPRLEATQYHSPGHLGSPRTPALLPAKAQQCQATGEGLARAVAGALASFQLICRDSEGGIPCVSLRAILLF
ncbi:hypothetical protein AB1Y20_017041 [Prymnesium parvum]|uniref:Uncharacterized protein n=1 Tax=Prymnesium parvum TaxID=97485 RepID=A0AB34I896_PRYPA